MVLSSRRGGRLGLLLAQWYPHRRVLSDRGLRRGVPHLEVADRRCLAALVLKRLLQLGDNTALTLADLFSFCHPSGSKEFHKEMVDTGYGSQFL